MSKKCRILTKKKKKSWILTVIVVVASALFLRPLGAKLWNFIPRSLKHQLETSDPLEGSWLVGKMKTLLRISFHYFLPEFPCIKV